MESNESFIKRFFLFSMGPFMAAGISFITIPLITWLLDPSDFGKYSIYISIYQVLLLITLLGLDQAFVREYNSYDDKKNLFWNSSMPIVIFSILISITVLVFGSSISTLLFETVEWRVIIALAISLPMAGIERQNSLLIRMQEKAKLFSLLTFIRQVHRFILIFIFLYMFESTFVSIVLAEMTSIIIQCILYFILNRNYVFYVPSIERSIQRKLFHYALPLIPSSIVFWMFSAIDKFSLRLWSNFEELGIYAAAFKVTAVISIFHVAFTNFWSPTVYRWYENGVKKSKYVKVSESVLSLMMIIGIFLVIFRDYIVLILSPEYKTASILIPFIAICPLLLVVSETTVLGINLKKKTKYHLYIAMITFVLNLTGNVLLVPNYGALGASISTAASYVVFFFLRTIISNNLWYKFKLRKYTINILLLIGLAFLSLLNELLIELSISVIILIYNYRSIQELINIFKRLFKKRIKH